MTSLLKKIQDYVDAGVCPMHMPGHKRCDALDEALPFQLDVTEINGFDNLHQQQGILADLSKNAATLYGSATAFPLINGSSCGIHAAIRAATQPGDTIVVARNCHQSVYYAIELNALKPVYLMPPRDPIFGICGSINPAQVEEVLACHPEAKLIVITSPTYEGVISPIKDIAAQAHARHIALLVDEAHGAHLGLHPGFPAEAICCGADIAVMSLHKTLPALTQTALLHLNSLDICKQAVARELAVFETSSPSYVLLASIDYCLRWLSKHRASLFTAYLERLGELDRRLNALNRFKLLAHGRDCLNDHPSIYAFDPGKLVISTKDTAVTGTQLAWILRNDYLIEIEMAYTDYVMAMTSICDSAENFTRLTDALLEIDTTLCMRQTGDNLLRPDLPGVPPLAFTASEARGREKAGHISSLSETVGQISLEYVRAYPPGIPLLVPGEIITQEMIDYIPWLMETGVQLHSDSGNLPQSIRTLIAP